MIEVVVTGEDETLLERLERAAAQANRDLAVKTLKTPTALEEYLKQRGPGTDTLILADLRSKAVLDTLRGIKANPGTRRTPVVGFVSPTDAQTIEEAYDDHINACVAVPESGPDEEDFEGAVESTVTFFTRSVRLPEGVRSGRQSS